MGNVKYIIYGAGKQGRTFLEFLKQKELDTCIIGFCDKRYDMIEKYQTNKYFVMTRQRNTEPDSLLQ